MMRIAMEISQTWSMSVQRASSGYVAMKTAPIAGATSDGIDTKSRVFYAVLPQARIQRNRGYNC
jgi:hypothetical protein